MSYTRTLTADPLGAVDMGLPQPDVLTSAGPCRLQAVMHWIFRNCLSMAIIDFIQQFVLHWPLCGIRLDRLAIGPHSHTLGAHDPLLVYN